MSTTTGRPATDLANFIGGFVAAEGCFIANVDRGHFAFTVALGATDQEMVDLLHHFFACGRTAWYLRRQSHYDDEATFVVRRLSDLTGVVVPFMDEHLPMSYKRTQYLAWRAELLWYCQHRAGRRRRKRSV